jgi:hypothetical protein
LYYFHPWVGEEAIGAARAAVDLVVAVSVVAGVASAVVVHLEDGSKGKTIDE